MNPADASVYSNTWSPTTWVLILTVIALGVVALMGAFLALVHHAIEQSATAVPRAPLAPSPDAASSPGASPHAVPPPHAA